MIVRAEACGRLDRREEGREWVDRILEISPYTTVKSFSDFLSGFYVPEVVTLQADALRKAGFAGRMTATPYLAVNVRRSAHKTRTSRAG
jgi:hypothetical protein